MAEDGGPAHYNPQRPIGKSSISKLKALCASVGCFGAKGGVGQLGGLHGMRRYAFEGTANNGESDTAPMGLSNHLSVGGLAAYKGASTGVERARVRRVALQRPEVAAPEAEPHFQAGVPLQAAQSPAQAFWSGGGASPFQSPAQAFWPGGGGGAVAFHNPAQAFWPGGGAAAFQSPAPCAAYSSGRRSAPPHSRSFRPFLRRRPPQRRPPVLTSVATYAISRATSTRGS